MNDSYQPSPETIASLDEYRSRWVAAFNRGDHDACADLYTDDAVFIMLNLHADDPSGNYHRVANGREEIRAWWAGVVGDGQFTNLRGYRDNVLWISASEAHVSYQRFEMGSRDQPGGVALCGIIHKEVWVRSGDRWLVHRDLTEATPLAS